VIVMKVRAHDVIDLLRPRTRRGKPLQPGNIEHVPERPRRLDLVVAAAAVDQDVLTTDLHEPAVDAELYEAAGRIIVARRKPCGVLGEDMLVEFGKNIARTIGRAIGLFDAGNVRLADREHSHGLAPIAPTCAMAIASRDQSLHVADDLGVIGGLAQLRGRIVPQLCAQVGERR
jgi:hypothetical protein